MTIKLKTSESWMDKYETSFTLEDFKGWPSHPTEFAYHFFEEIITKEEFLSRATKSKITWHVSRL